MERGFAPAVSRELDLNRKKNTKASMYGKSVILIKTVLGRIFGLVTNTGPQCPFDESHKQNAQSENRRDWTLKLWPQAVQHGHLALHSSTTALPKER
jgi:hypothetical protein